MSNRAEAERLVRDALTYYDSKGTLRIMRPALVLAIEAALDSAREEGRREERANRESVWLTNVEQIKAQAYARGVEETLNACDELFGHHASMLSPEAWASMDAEFEALRHALVPKAEKEGIGLQLKQAKYSHESGYAEGIEAAADECLADCGCKGRILALLSEPVREGA